MVEAADHVPFSIMTKGLAQEKQITIDPASFVSTRDEDFRLHLPPLPPARSKFLSLSLPNSATSSPRFTSTFHKKNKKRLTQDDNSRIPSCMASPYMAVHSDLTRARLLHRSKSCGEGRTSAPSVDFDIMSLHPVHAFPKPFIPTTLLDHRSTNPTPGGTYIEEDDPGLDRVDSKEQEQEEFKCGAMCLFLPGFGKAKAIKGKRDRQADAVMPTVMSRTVSLEKFECGSWASAGINTNDNSGELPSSGNLYFDLPLELIRGIKNDTNHPVTAAFVFDKDLKGVLRNGSRSSTWKRIPAGVAPSPRPLLDIIPTHIPFCFLRDPSTAQSQGRVLGIPGSTKHLKMKKTWRYKIAYHALHFRRLHERIL